MVGLGGHNEVVAVQAADLERPPGDGDGSPLGDDAGMVTLFFGQLADGDGEGQGLAEVAETEGLGELLDAVLRLEGPVGDLRVEFGDLSVGDLGGEDNAIWGSDYPHPDGVWPDSRLTIEQDLGRLDERRRQKIICENAGKLYGFLA